MIDKVLVENKLRKIEIFLKELTNENVDINSLKEFQENIILKRFIERNIELCIEQVIDICKHIVSGLDLKEPESYGECFHIISNEGIIKNKNVPIYESMARFRNLIIHSYDSSDDSIVYGIYKKRLDDFKLYIKEVRIYMKGKQQI